VRAARVENRWERGVVEGRETAWETPWKETVKDIVDIGLLETISDCQQTIDGWYMVKVVLQQRW